MDFKELKIVFMGTPEFAVTSLNVLVEAGCNIVGVITAPDKPAGRGMQLQQTAVKRYALERNLNILQPEKLKDPDFLDRLRFLKADLQTVVAFRMLPEVVWNMPPLGTVNVHGSILPQYRGAAPINWAIINGEEFTGVTTFKLQHEIDTGNILLTDKIKIGEDENAGLIHDRLKEKGAELLLKTIRGIADNSITEVPQSIPASDIRHAPKLSRETGKINWNMPVKDVYNLIRGLSPYPAAFTNLADKTVKVFSAEKIFETPQQAPGTIRTDKKDYLQFACTDGYINITELQPEGKKRMDVKDFLRGYRFG